MSKSIDHIAIKKISEVLGAYSKGSELTKLFKRLNYFDHDALYPSHKLSTKWRRIENTLNHECKNRKSAKPVFTLIQQLLNPALFIKDGAGAWNEARKEINEILIFYGFELSDAGKVQKTIIAENFTDAQQRLALFKDKLEMYNVHPLVIQYCREELFVNNYFHAIFESSKGIMDRLRDISELVVDGTTLVNRSFNSDKPLIMIKGNMISTQTEKSEYNGLKHLLNTIVCLYRNPKAHEPKLYDQTSLADAITAFTIMSLAHRTLDKCVNIRDFSR